MSTCLFTDPRCLLHHPGSANPERAERLSSILSSLHNRTELITTNRIATREELELAHDPSYVTELLSRSGESFLLDHETPISTHSIESARHAAGAGLTMIDAILDGKIRRGFALIRPPGHHANRQRGGGFCIFNNIAIATNYAQKRGISRTLIIDWDVHHGNGTQAIFYDRRDVFFFDVHQDGLYPETGNVEERGVGEGLGFTRNLPLIPLSNDDDYIRAVQSELPQIAASYQPQLVLVSCGFDAHAGDPEGGMSLSATGFARLAAIAKGLADRYCEGRLALFLEGGYLVSALPWCVHATLAALQESAPG